VGELDRLATDLDSHHIEGFAVHGGASFSVPLISHITGNLWTGGCRNGVELPHDFRYVVSLYPFERYVLGPDTERIEVPLLDSSEPLGDGDEIYEVARFTLDAIRDAKTLVHCQAGLNRSGLVGGLALVLSGTEPEDAIALLREQRSPSVLCNRTFERWLLGQEPGPTD